MSKDTERLLQPDVPRANVREGKGKNIQEIGFFKVCADAVSGQIESGLFVIESLFRYAITISLYMIKFTLDKGTSSDFW